MQITILLFKVAHLDVSEAHHPNLTDWLILYCLSSVKEVASHIY